MTADAPSPRTNTAARAGALLLTAALLLAASGLFALPAGLFSQAYYTDTWHVMAGAAPASVLPTLVLMAVAVARGSRTFLLVMTAGATLHLAALTALALVADAGLDDAGPVWFGLWTGPVQLGLALVALALAWWNRVRAGSSQWVPLLLLALAPPFGQYISGVRSSSDTFYLGPWGPVLAAALAVSLSLTILAAGLVCLPGREPQVSGAVLIVLTGFSLFVTDLVLGRPPHPYRLAVVGLALCCAVAGIVARQALGVDDDAALADTEDTAGPVRFDAGAPAAPSDATDREFVTTSDTAVVVVPSPPAADEGTEGGPADPSGRTGALTLAALTVLVLTVALYVPELFAHGPGIRPAAGGILLLMESLVDASLPAVLVLAAGAATLRSRRALRTAIVSSGLLVIVLLVSRTALGGTVTFGETLPFVALGLSGAIAWTGMLRPGAHGLAWRWTAVVPLVLASPPLRMLFEPGVTMHAWNPAFVPQLVLPILVSGLGPLLAAALFCFPHHRARVAGAVLLGLVAIAAMIGTLQDAVFGLRVLTALNLLQVGGYAASAVLVVSATLAPRAGR
ncbi:hypothetical protein ACQEVI_04180 [Promicromonospora sp. CA-289599]|uniref:hypothetical protein n=1 Tax=Promicromonospora sp. CA-289599 TaxID=3240014 RepID=UPI003D8C0456